MWLRDGIYSRLLVRGQQLTVVRRRAHDSDVYLMLDGHVRTAVADSPVTDEKYVSS